MEAICEAMNEREGGGGDGGGEEEREREGKMTWERTQRRTGMDTQQRDAWRVDSAGWGRARLRKGGSRRGSNEALSRNGVVEVSLSESKQ